MTFDPNADALRAELAQLRFEIGERRKELGALHVLSRRLLQPGEVGSASWLQGVVDLLPPAFLAPASTHASASVGTVEVMTAGYAAVVGPQHPRIRVGWTDDSGILSHLEVVRVAVPAGEAPFLSEEHELVEPIAGLIRAAMFGVHATKLQEGAQQALRWSEDRLQAALDATGVGIVDWDLRAERATLTETARVIMGLPEGQLEATAADIRGCIHPDDYERMRANFHLERLFGRARSHEYRVKHPDGTVRWVSSRGRMTMDDHGDVVRRLSIMMDVTERRVLQEQLQHAQRLEAMGQLAGGMAHDFNNLLTVIGAAAEFIADAAAQGGPMHADAEEVLKAVRSGKALTRQLLTFSRRQVVRHERVDLNAVVRSCDALVKRLITANVSLHQECAANPVVVEIDPHQLEQVLINLVINARDAMPSGGMLTIRADTAVRHDDPTYPGEEIAPRLCAHLSVHDTGIGMDEATRTRIFEPFFTTKDALHGTGLGLSTVFGIVRQAGGTIEVESEPRLGATFHIYLPLASGIGADAVGTTDAAPPDPLGTETILLVEDEPRVRMLARRMLTSLGYTVIESADGIEAVEFSQNHPGPIHLLLSDVVLPGPTGREVADALALSRPGLPVLFMSGYTADEVLVRALAASGAPFLEKPFTRASLAAAVRHAIDNGPRRAAVQSAAVGAESVATVTAR